MHWSNSPVGFIVVELLANCAINQLNANSSVGRCENNENPIYIGNSLMTN